MTSDADRKGILDLPITLLESLASLLSVKDRVSLTCTCRQLMQLGNTSKALWAVVDVMFQPSATHLAGLACWLRRKADLVGCLHLIEARTQYTGAHDDFTNGFLLGALAGSHSLRHLVLTRVMGQGIGGWAAGLPALHKLEIVGDEHVRLSPSCSQRTRLNSLQLTDSKPATWSLGQEAPTVPRGSLPPNLPVQDLLLGQAACAVAPDASSSSGLRVLEISRAYHDSPLCTEGMGTLERLTLLRCQLDAPPPQLSALTRLQILDLSGNMGLGYAGGGWEVFLALRQLCCLSLAGCGLQALPHSVAMLSGLKSLDICRNPKLRSLPPAAFWTELLALGVDLHCLCRSWAAVPQEGGGSEGALWPCCSSMGRLRVMKVDREEVAAAEATAMLGKVLDELPALERVLLSQGLAELLASNGRVGGPGSTVFVELKQLSQLAIIVDSRPTSFINLVQEAWPSAMPAGEDGGYGMVVY